MLNFMKNSKGTPAIELGKKYKDSLHGVEGVATCHSRYVTGCDRVCLEYIDAGTIKELWVDITRLSDIDIPVDQIKAGGSPSKAPMKTTG